MREATMAWRADDRLFCLRPTGWLSLLCLTLIATSCQEAPSVKAQKAAIDAAFNASREREGLSNLIRLDVQSQATNQLEIAKQIQRAKECVADGKPTECFPIAALRLEDYSPQGGTGLCVFFYNGRADAGTIMFLNAQRKVIATEALPDIVYGEAKVACARLLAVLRATGDPPIAGVNDVEVHGKPADVAFVQFLRKHDGSLTEIIPIVRSSALIPHSNGTPINSTHGTK